MNLHKFYGYILVTILLYSCNSTSSKLEEGNYVIKATIEGLSDGTKILLKKQQNDTTISIDSTTAQNEMFEFTGSIETPEVYGIFIDSMQGRLLPVVESGNINITAHRDSLYRSVITGSKLNDELDMFKKGSEEIVSKINDLFIQIQKARAENDLETINEINGKMKAINNENTRYSLNYAKNNPESFISSIVLNSTLRTPDIDSREVASIYAKFSEEVKKSESARSVSRYLKANESIQKDSIK